MKQDHEFAHLQHLYYIVSKHKTLDVDVFPRYAALVFTMVMAWLAD